MVIDQFLCCSSGHPNYPMIGDLWRTDGVFPVKNTPIPVISYPSPDHSDENRAPTGLLRQRCYCHWKPIFLWCFQKQQLYTFMEKESFNVLQMTLSLFLSQSLLHHVEKICTCIWWEGQRVNSYEFLWIQCPSFVSSFVRQKFSSKGAHRIFLFLFAWS